MLPYNTLTEKSQEAYKKKFPNGPYTPYPVEAQVEETNFFSGVTNLVVGMLLGVVLTALYYRNNAQFAYQPIR